LAQYFVSEGRCQFCHTTAGNVEHMIAGDSGFICNACVVACSALLQPAASQADAEERPDRYAFQRLARHFAPLRPQELLATSRSFALRQQADLQAALDELFGDRVVPPEVRAIEEGSYRWRQARSGPATLLGSAFTTSNLSSATK